MALGTGQISLGNVNSLGSPLFTGATSLANRDTQAMGNVSPANVTSSRVCMPYETINETLSSLARDTPGIGSAAEGSWTYTGPGPIWAPHRLKEFWGAYSNIPFANVSTRTTGTINNGRLIISIGGEYAAVESSFYSVNGGAWVQLAPNTTANLAINNGTFVVRVKDWYNCGTNREISSTVTYP
jgi:hypothetical protein